MMKRGISPVIATVILITLAVVAGASLYFWSMSYSPRPELPKEPIKISVRPVNQTAIKIVNLGMSSIPLSNISLSNGAVLECSNKTLEPGGTVSCEIKNTTEGEVAIVISGQEVETPTIIVHTGDIDPPSFAGITDNWHYSIVGDTITVTATISDNVGVDKAVLYYKPPGGSWSSESMSRISGTEKYGQWQASFTPNSVGNWEYYVWANDTSGNERTSNTVSRAIGVVKFISPTPADGAAISSKDFTINLTLAGDPRRIVLNFNGTNFTIFGSDELYYFKFDENGYIANDTFNSSRNQWIYSRMFLGYVPTSTSEPLTGWSGQNIQMGDFDWCGGSGGSVYYAKSTINHPTIGTSYILKYNGTEVWNLTNVTNIYFDVKFNVSSDAFSNIKVCLVDINGKQVCHRDTGTFTAGSNGVIRHLWYNPCTSYVKDGTYFSGDSDFNWSSVTAFLLNVTSNTTDAFTMQLAPVRIAFPYDGHGTGLWGLGLDNLKNKQVNVEQNWCWSGTTTLLRSDGNMIANHDFTASIWIRYNGTQDPYEHGIFEVYGDSYWCDGFGISKEGSNIVFRVGYAPCTSSHYSNNTYVEYHNWDTLKDGKWHMITGVANDSKAYLYIDGTKVNESTLPQKIYAPSDWGNIGSTGASISWSGQPFWGQEDEAHIYRYALTPDQVKLLYHLEYGRWYAKLHNLNPGEYAFKVYATTNLGSSSTETREINIV